MNRKNVLHGGQKNPKELDTDRALDWAHELKAC